MKEHRSLQSTFLISTAFVEYLDACFRGHPKRISALLGGNVERMGTGGRRGLSCKWTSFSVWSFEGRRGHLKVILSSSSCVEDWKIKRLPRNKYIMHVFFEDILFFHHFCSSLTVFQLSVHIDRGAVEQKVDRHGQGEGGGLRAGKNV